jgi:hypothetical protein
VAGLDGQILEWIRCYGCNRLSHVKKKDGQVNCPSWTESIAAPAAVISKVGPRQESIWTHSSRPPTRLTRETRTPWS